MNSSIQLSWVEDIYNEEDKFETADPKSATISCSIMGQLNFPNHVNVAPTTERCPLNS